MEVIGYPNYLIYPDGKVQNKKTKRYIKKSDSAGYDKVGLCVDRKTINCKVHRLLAIHYIPNPDNTPCVDHINGNKKDNRLENPRWVDKSENGLNREHQVNNKLGIKNIHYDKSQDRFIYQKKIRDVIHYKSFKTLEEAIAYKEDYERE